MSGARRLVTGHKDGKSVIVADEPLDEFDFGPYNIQQIWAATSLPPQVPYTGAIDLSGPWFPPAGSIRSFRVSLAPESSVVDDPDPAAAADAAARMPGALEHFEPDRPGMHTTQSVDIGIVQSGEVWLELDDDQEVKLSAGDYVIQNGTRHAWHNRSNEPCVMNFVLIGADSKG